MILGKEFFFFEKYVDAWRRLKRLGAEMVDSLENVWRVKIQQTCNQQSAEVFDGELYKNQDEMYFFMPMTGRE